MSHCRELRKCVQLPILDVVDSDGRSVVVGRSSDGLDGAAPFSSSDPEVDLFRLPKPSLAPISAWLPQIHIFHSAVRQP
jgi:hypothetical protein